MYIRALILEVKIFTEWEIVQFLAGNTLCLNLALSLLYVIVQLYIEHTCTECHLYKLIIVNPCCCPFHKLHFFLISSFLTELTPTL